MFGRRGLAHESHYMYIGSVGRLLAHSNMSYMMLLFLLVGIIVLIVYFMPKKLRTKIMFLSV